MIAVPVILTAIAGFVCGFSVGRLPSVPRFYRRRRALLPGARIVLERRRDQRADISTAVRGSHAG